MSDSGYFQGGSWNQLESSSDWYYSNTTAGSGNRITVNDPYEQIKTEGQISQDGNQVWIGGKWVEVWKDDVVKAEPSTITFSGHSHGTYTDTGGDKINKIIDILDQMANALENQQLCQGIKEQINALKESVSYWPGFSNEPDDEPENEVKEFEWYLPKRDRIEKYELEEELFEI